MDPRAFVEPRVHESYWKYDTNCAITTLHILGAWFDVPIAAPVIDAALGMHGAGGYRAQCGLVEGGLMFLGILGRARGWTDADIVATCKAYAAAFETKFGSLLCRELRPQGFSPDNPPHLCEGLTNDAIVFDIAFITERLERIP